jgi:ankyrin repeat protein
MAPYKVLGPETYDPFEAAAIWLSEQPESKRAALTDIQQIVDDVMERRSVSGSPLQPELVMSMLAMRSLPSAALPAIAAMSDVDRPERRTGYTPLMLATLMGHRSAVSALLARGANVNAQDNEGSTALLFVKDPGIAMMLMEAEPDLNLASEDGVTVTHVLAANHSMAHIVRLALLRGANPNAADDEGDTPLHVAATAEIVEMLVAAGADPNRRNTEGKTPLLTVLEEGDMEAAAALVPITTTGLQEALKEAINAKQDTIAVALIAAGAPVHSWKRVAEAAKRFGLHRLEVVARERGGRRRYTVKKSSR